VDHADYFSPDYAVACERFRAAARRSGAAFEALSIGARGPASEPLTIDVARLGSPAAQRVLLHVSGVHGVEAFAGAAVQLAALGEPPVPPAGCALVLVHVLNPFGMAWLRRANENNVDLNRNFLKPGEPWRGAPELYRRIDALLNPRSKPARDFFHLRLALRALRHGVQPLKQAIAEGQYEFPQGLFYGGDALQPGPAALLEWLKRNLASASYLFALDLHTGLGAMGGEMLILEPGMGATDPQTLGAAIERALIDPGASGEQPYRIRGGLGSALPDCLPEARIDYILQELGTRAPDVVLRALRDENRWHHYGSRSLTHPAKLALREALCPAARDWRAQAVEQGLALIRAAARWTFDGRA
jgi:hypothetical protein